MKKGLIIGSVAVLLIAGGLFVGNTVFACDGPAKTTAAKASGGISNQTLNDVKKKPTTK